MRKVTVHYGDNGSQEFWEDENGQLLMFRNKGVKVWIGMLHGRTPNDPVLKPSSKGGSVPLQGKSVQELMEKLKDHFGIEAVMDGYKAWQWGQSRTKMELMEV